MKKLFTVMMLLLSISLGASAKYKEKNVWIGDIRYQIMINDYDRKYDYARVIGYKGEKGKEIKKKEKNDATITDVVIPDSVTYKNNTYPVEYIGTWAFLHCKSLKSIILPKTVKDICAAAFSGCSSLEKVVLNGPCIISTYVFENCRNLKEVVNLDIATEIGSQTFKGCASLSNITIAKACKVDETAFPSDMAKTIRYVDNSSIADGMADGYWIDDIKYRIVKSDVDEKKNCARVIGYRGENTEHYQKKEKNDATITDVVIPESVTYKNNTYPVEYIGTWAFQHCKSLKSIILPKTVANIDYNAFEGCDNLERVVLNGSCEISGYAFENCRNLKEVVNLDLVTKIGHAAFSDCEALSNITIGENCKVDEDAFESSEVLLQRYEAQQQSEAQRRAQQVEKKTGWQKAFEVIEIVGTALREVSNSINQFNGNSGTTSTVNRGASTGGTSQSYSSTTYTDTETPRQVDRDGWANTRQIDARNTSQKVYERYASMLISMYYGNTEFKQSNWDDIQSKMRDLRIEQENKNLYLDSKLTRRLLLNTSEWETKSPYGHK